LASAVNIPETQIQWYCIKVEDTRKGMVDSSAAVKRSTEKILELAASLGQLLSKQPSERTSSAASWLAENVRAIHSINQTLDKLTKLSGEAQSTIHDVAVAGRSNNDLAGLLTKTEQIRYLTNSMYSIQREMTRRPVTAGWRTSDQLKADETLYAKYQEFALSIGRTAQSLEQLRSASHSMIQALNYVRRSVESITKPLDKKLSSAMIVIMPDDQKIAAFKEFIVVRRYGAARSGISLQISPEMRRNNRVCIFRDAEDQPVAGAPLQIRFSKDRNLRQPLPGVAPTEPHIIAHTTTLDAEGCARFPVLIEADLPIAYYVVHKDCGPLCAQPIGLSRTDKDSRLFRVPALPKDKWTVFLDALGQPIPNATVTIYRGQTYARRTDSKPATCQLDAAGRLKPPLQYTRLQFTCFVISHPDYGTAIAEPRPKGSDGLLETCTVPLVKIGTEAQVRSIWGTVVDPNGKPVPGVVLECRDIATPGGGSMGPGYGHYYRTLTDKEGFFSLYVPLDRTDQNDITLVPLASTYRVTVKPPKELPLKEQHARIKSGIASTITLEYAAPQQKAFHTFSFCDEDGPITDTLALVRMRLHVRAPGSNPNSRPASLEYKQWKDGGIFPIGTYTAYLLGREELVFEPVEIAHDSPEHIVFLPKPPATREFYGRVVHGVTGQPIHGAIVFLKLFVMGPTPANFTTEQWQNLYVFASQPDLDKQTREELIGDLGIHFEAIAASDDSGFYRLDHSSAKPDRISTIIVLAQNYLGTQSLGTSRRAIAEAIRSGTPTDTSDEHMDVPLFKLFPAARVVVEPNMPFDWKKGRPEIEMTWSVDLEGNPAWAADFLDYERKTGFYFWNRPLPNETQSISVPASLNMTITFTERRVKKWHTVVFPDIKLDQGQVLDLGKLTFHPLLRIAAHLVGPDGRPIEGVSVRATIKVDGLFLLPQSGITDKNGIAWFNAPPGSLIRFEVRHQPRWDGTPGTRPPAPTVEFVEYQITGPEDTNGKFTFKLSDEMLELLFH